MYPESNIYLKTDLYQRLTDKEPKEGEKVMLIIQKENTPRDELTEDSFYPIGVSGSVSEVNSNGYLVIRTRSRRNLDEVTVYSDHSIELSVTKRLDIEDLEPEVEKQHLEQLKKEMMELASASVGGGSQKLCGPADFSQ